MDLDGARHIGYRVEQSFRYAYDAPVTALAQRLVVVPRRRHGDLYRRRHRCVVSGRRHARRARLDAAGNTVVRVVAARVEQAVEFRLTATLDRVVGDGPPRLPAAALHDPRMLRADPAHGRRRGAAGPGCPLRRAGRQRGAGRADLRGRPRGPDLPVRRDDGQTTAAQALAGGRGVCQDSAHVMLAMCRLLGVPARYVSGHLVGQGGTHAWVEVLVARGATAAALAFDPCHGRRAGNSYVTVAVGRDYADVAPTSGTYVGTPGGTLTGTREVSVTSVT